MFFNFCISEVIDISPSNLDYSLCFFQPGISHDVLCMMFPDSSVGKEFTCNAGDPVRKIHWRRDRLPTPVFLGFPCGSAGKEFACNVGDLGSIPGLGRSPGEGKGYLLRYSGLENSMDCIVHGVAESQTRLSNFHERHHLPSYL